MDWMIIVLHAAIGVSTPLLLAGMGELLTEKSGVLNLGVEGIMLIGCVVAFIVAVLVGDIFVACVVAVLSGCGMALLFSLFTIFGQVNQVVTGLSLTILGVGLSAFIGLAYIGVPLEGLGVWEIPLLASIPVVGPIFFTHDVIVYCSFCLVLGLHYFFYYTRWGLVLRAVGENHTASHALGYRVVTVRLLATVLGGGMIALAGAYLSLVHTPLWSENMTAGRGWIALALVAFSGWQPYRLVLGAWLFGLIGTGQLFLQGVGWFNYVPTEFIAMLPYVATIVALMVMSNRKTHHLSGAPACLGRTFELK